jgi:hypothetical protein
MRRKNTGICGNFDEGMQTQMNVGSMVVLWYQFEVHAKFTYNNENVAMTLVIPASIAIRERGFPK